VAAWQDAGMVLGNCPFHTLAKKHTEIVCGMNLCLITGLLTGLNATGLHAELHPTPEHCCVRIQFEDTTQPSETKRSASAGR
jgi:predicted ArsR family transcriptional regulator